MIGLRGMVMGIGANYTALGPDSDKYTNLLLRVLLLKHLIRIGQPERPNANSDEIIGP